MVKTNRNGKIELLRFYFCISVLLYHICKDIWGGTKLIGSTFSFFEHGRTGVEFFFLVSGFLVAKKVYQTQNDGVKIGESTFRFIYGKINSVFLPHIIINCCIIIFFIVAKDNAGKLIWDRIPSLFFLQKTGISMSYFSAVEWYICSMLLALAVIYPMLKKNYDVVARIIAPVASVMLIGYLIQTYNELPSSSHFGTYTYNGNIRAFADILLGVFSFEVSRRIKEADLTKIQRVLLIVAENICWIFAIYFMFSQLSRKFEGYVTIALAFAIAVTFSRNITSKIYNNQFVYFLGKISLTVYLSQNLIRMISNTYLSDLRVRYQILFVTVGTIVFGIAIHYLCIFIRKCAGKRSKKIKA